MELEHKDISCVSESYIKVLTQGIENTFVNLSKEDIKKYLKDCGKKGGK